MDGDFHNIINYIKKIYIDFLKMKNMNMRIIFYKYLKLILFRMYYFIFIII